MTSLWGFLMAGVRGEHRFGPWSQAGRQHIPHLSHCSRAGTAFGTAGWQSWHSTAQERARTRQGGEGAALHPCVGEQCAGQAPAHSSTASPAGTSPGKGQGAPLRAVFSPCEQQPGHGWLCLGLLGKSPKFSSHHPLSLPRGLTVTHKTPVLLQWLKA